MRRSTCFTTFSNSTGTCDNALAMQLTNKLCCCSVGRGWLDPGTSHRKDSLLCDACPIKDSGKYNKLIKDFCHYIVIDQQVSIILIMILM